jgi:hypothetical protein
MPPLGGRIRLKASFDMSVFADPYYDHFRKLAVSFQNYGLIVTDNGGHGQVSGTNDARWGPYDSAIRYEATYFFALLPLHEFEVVQLGWTSAGQLAVPIADVAAGSWTTHLGSAINLYATVDEAVADDLDSIHSAAVPSDDTCILSLTALPTPADGTVTLQVRAKQGWGSVTVPFFWDAVAGATSYILIVGTTPMQSVGDVHNDNVGNVLTHDVVLPSGRTYYGRSVVVGGAHAGELTAGGEQPVTV